MGIIGAMLLKDYIAERGETVEQFAERVGESPHTIAKLFRGDRFPRLDLAQRIISATEGRVTADDLLEAAVARNARTAEPDRAPTQAAA